MKNCSEIGDYIYYRLTHCEHTDKLSRNSNWRITEKLPLTTLIKLYLLGVEIYLAKLKLTHNNFKDNIVQKSEIFSDLKTGTF